MFSGIIQALGTVEDTCRHGTGMSITIRLDTIDSEPVSSGDSIAVNGVCLTVNKLDKSIAHFDISSETLDKSLFGYMQSGDPVNLEPALTLNTRLGGHLVSGHVDGIARLTQLHHWQQFTEMVFFTDKKIGRFLAAKGSVSMDGISLTTNKVEDRGDETCFSIMLVPHTLTHTTLGNIADKGDICIGHQVHIEVDQVARYIHRLLEVQTP